MTGISITGGEAIIAALKGKTREIAVGTAVGINETANDLQRVAQTSMKGGGGSVGGNHPSAPGSPPNVQTGNLRRSIAVDRATTQNLEALVEARAEYAAHLEFGTSRMPARPFMTPAREEVMPRHADNIAREIRKRIGS